MTIRPIVIPFLLAALAPQAAAQATKTPKSTQGIPDTMFDGSRHRKMNEAPNPLVDRADPSVLDKNDSAAAPLGSPPPMPGTGPVAAPAFSGTPRDGLREIERLARGGRGPEAAALARELAARVPESRANELLLAELNYAGGVASSLAQDWRPAVKAFESASALAGAGELRRDALYNAGVQLIEEGEALYQEIPEIAAQRMADDPLVKSSSVGMGSDTLPDARARFTEARAALLDRLRLDWRDADTRANLELAQRRLERIARIAEKREDPAKDKKSEDGKETEKTEEGESGKDGQEESEQQPEEDGDVGRNPDTDTEHTEEAEPKPGEGAEEGDQQPNPDAAAEDDAPQPKLEEQEEGEEDPELTSEAGGAEQDLEMSQEEMRMILDRLNQIEEDAKKLRAAIMRTRVIPVERDW